VIFHSVPVSICLVDIRECGGEERRLFLEGGKFDSSRAGKIGFLGKEVTVI
jgi:hypothetical protein